MIKNAREYQITKAQASKFESALRDATLDDLDPAAKALEQEAVRSQLADLQAELEEYNALEAGKYQVLEADDLSELPRALIQARIAGGLSQRDLADRLGLKEQQIQRYEATDYASASLTRVLEVVRALNVKLRQDVVLPSADLSTKTLRSHLRRLGFDADFIESRLVLDGDGDNAPAWRTAKAIGRVLRLPVAQLVAGDFRPLPQAAASAMFKLPARGNESKLIAYSAYVRYLAERTLECTAVAPKQRLPDQPREVFQILREQYGGVTFDAALRFVWDLGIPVLPLCDAGSFHGAFWRIGGRAVIVLKQRSSSSGRWLIDLLHEYYHAVQTQDQSDAEFLESDESPYERRESEAELTATAWATAASLDSREDEIAQVCIDEAVGEIPRLKRVVPRVALREHVPVDVLANYVAYKLARHEQGDWWGTATSLSVIGESPWRQARDTLLSHAEVHKLDHLDRELFSRALQEKEN
jgi:ribosome-binding protein aMBF1 (putative translation factor)